jgi:hypothetical protein
MIEGNCFQKQIHEPTSQIPPAAGRVADRLEPFHDVRSLLLPGLGAVLAQHG